MPTLPTYAVGIDVGGTFTDFVAWVDGRLAIYKAATTPHDQSEAMVHGLDALQMASDTPVVHGTTVATNALLEHRGARTALITTAGFADVLALGRQNRPDLYAFSQTRPPALVPAALRFEVDERLDYTGAVLRPLRPEALPALMHRLREADIESVAVVLLYAFQNPTHEQQIAQALAQHLPEATVALSSDILPEYREYERTATTVISAYVQPLVARYMNRLSEALGRRPVRVMQSNGGTISLGQAAEQAARLVLSGPAGGVVGAFALAQQALGIESPNVLTFDMGGTSTDVALCAGALPFTSESTIAGLPLRLPSTDIHTVGAGGGSIARVDAGGVLRVGPESAGARPGPACYGHGGTAPTVTDANLVLGYLDADRFLGGDTALQLDADAARAVLAELGTALGRSPEAAALGVLRVANATMERALRRVSVERGYDPRTCTLIPFGGAGPLHACALAEALDVRRILIPPTPGVLSALGLLMADVVYDEARALLTPLATLIEKPALLETALADLQARIRTALADERLEELAFTAQLDLRYAGQSYELAVPLALPLTADTLEATAVAFHDAHAQRYGHAHPEAPLEAVTLRVRGTIPGLPLDLPKQPRATNDAAIAHLGDKPAWFAADHPTPTPCYDRTKLMHGHVFAGPALVYQYDTTIVILPGWHVEVDAWGNLNVQHS